MKKFYILFYFFTFLTLHGFSQPVPTMEWEQCIKDGSYKTIAKVSDELFAVAGVAYGCDIPNSISLRLLESNGSIQWEKEYDFGEDYDDQAYSLAHTADGGFIFSGYENQAGTAFCNLIVKTNNAGDTIWTKKIFIGTSPSPVTSSIIQTSDGGYCFVGSEYTADLWDVQVIKLDASGNISWSKNFGGTANDYGKDIVQTTDGGYLISATSSSNNGDVSGNHGESDIWVIKLKASGTLDWQHCYGGTGFDEAQSLVTTVDQGFAVLGVSTSSNGDVSGHYGSTAYHDYWLMKINNDGDLQWNKNYGGTHIDFASQLIEASDGTLILAGSSYSDDIDVSNHHGTTNYNDMWVVVVDDAGSIIWNNSYGGTDYDNCGAVGLLNDEEIIVAGSTLSDDGDHIQDCIETTCYPIAAYWMVKINSACEFYPVADFTYTITDNTFHFTNTSVNAESYFWDFGDGNTSTAKNPNHNYDPDATYEVCLTAYLNSCGENTKCETINTCKPLTPDFTTSFSGLTVSFLDNTADAVQWVWHFGDGSTDSIKNPVHTYPQQGDYEVTLYVYNACGVVYDTSVTISTCAGLIADFNFELEGNTYYFIDISLGEPDSWLWDFGDGGTSTLQNPSHTYASGDSFDVCLTIDHTQCDAGDTKCEKLNACTIPVVADFDFTLSDNLVTFDNTSENAGFYLWDFGDGTTSTQKNPTHVYPLGMSTYNVCMIAKGECKNDTICEVILVGKNPVTANFTYSSLGLTVVFTNLSTNASTYFWDFGDGATSTNVNPLHTYSTNGIYEVCLIATDQFSLSDTFCQSVFLCTQFNGDFTYEENGLTVSFFDDSPDAAEWFWQFGDGGTSILKNPTHTYAANGTYQACLISSNVCGFSDTTCKSITICAPIVPDYSFLDTYLSVQFTDLTVGATDWLWSFDDASTSTLKNPVHNYASAGSYNVCLVAIDLCGNSASTCKTVTVCTPIISDFSYSANDLTVTFNNQTGNAVQWEWDFGDGNVSTNKSPVHTYTSNGTYEVCLTSTDECGNSDETCETITVCQPLTGDFSYSDTYLTVSFTDLTPFASGWTWYFGDSNTSSSQNPTHTYAVPGDYDACLVASDVCNNSDLICKTITVCAPITASFSSSSFYLTAAFTDLTGSAVEWKWDFGDGFTSTNQNPAHTYSADGTYTICLIATDECGNDDTSCQSITVCAPLAANFSFNTTDLTASFTDLSGSGTQWFWDFGDGVTSTSQSPSHTYPANGTYTVCLTVTNLCGETNTTCESIKVCMPLNSDFSYDAIDLFVEFTDLSTDAIQWFWDFGDGGISINQNPIHTYVAAGTYEVCLIAFNLCATDTICKLVEVLCPAFNANFIFEATNYTVIFSDVSNNAVQWLWEFGDGATSTLADPVHVYTDEGEYNVCLTASDDCTSDSTCQLVSVIISSDGSMPEGISSLTIYPNPFSDEATIAFTLEKASSLKIDLIDVQGRNLLSLADRDFSAGTHSLQLDKLNMAPGIYFLQMMGKEGKAIRKVIIE